MEIFLRHCKFYQIWMCNSVTIAFKSKTFHGKKQFHAQFNEVSLKLTINCIVLVYYILYFSQYLCYTQSFNQG